jgi:mono/diheme cytochrome c family protein
MECGTCHGPDGRGDGEAAAGMRDDAGRQVFAFDMTRSWLLKGGITPEDIYRTIHTGLDGTPMPAYQDLIDEADGWALVHFVRSLFQDRE